MSWWRLGPQKPAAHWVSGTCVPGLKRTDMKLSNDVKAVRVRTSLPCCVWGKWLMKHKNNFSLVEIRSYGFKPGALYRVDPNSRETQSDVSTSFWAKAGGVHKAPFCSRHSSVPLRIGRAVVLRCRPARLAACLSVCIPPATHKTYVHKTFVHIHLTSDLYTEVGQQGFRERCFLPVWMI